MYMYVYLSNPSKRERFMYLFAELSLGGGTLSHVYRMADATVLGVMQDMWVI